MSPGKATKKPVEIEFRRYDGSRKSIDAICQWANTDSEGENIVEYVFRSVDDVDDPTIATLEGYLSISKGDVIIKGVQGEFYPCKPDIFAKTYNVTLEES